LVAPFGLKILSKAAYWLICRPGTRAAPVVEKFRQWPGNGYIGNWL
jgi:hypothetical protein